MSYDVRINNGKGSYLYCDINDNPCDYADQYDSADECINDLLPAVESCCQQRGYDEQETTRLKNHYAIKVSNYNGAWKDQYKNK